MDRFPAAPSTRREGRSVARYGVIMRTTLRLATAALGGWLGAHHVHRVYHLRTYTRHGVVR